MKNLKEIKTTILAIIFLAVGLYELFATSEDKSVTQWSIIIGCGVFAIGLALAPDRIVNFMFKWLDKKTVPNKEEGQKGDEGDPGVLPGSSSSNPNGSGNGGG